MFALFFTKLRIFNTEFIWFDSYIENKLIQIKIDLPGLKTLMEIKCYISEK